jgi:AbrB family looped-hinge helix DNA binding protein
MKEKIGVIKEIDKHGRIVIPKEMRDRLGFEDSVEVVVTEDGILIRNPEYKLIRIYESKND